MADKKHWHDWLALGISLLSLAIAGITAYRNVFNGTTSDSLWVIR